MASEPVKVLGVDPGLTRCGLAVVAGPVGSPRCVATDCLRTDSAAALEDRLVAVHDAVAAAIGRHQPDAVAVERVLFSSNARTAMATGQAAGVALLAAGRAGVPVHAYTPTQVKLTVAGAGDADKDAVARLVAAQLRLDAPPRPADVADALAVALTHLAQGRLAAAAAGTPAAAVIEDARSAAARSGARGWEAHLAARGLLPDDTAAVPGGRRGGGR